MEADGESPLTFDLGGTLREGLLEALDALGDGAAGGENEGLRVFGTGFGGDEVDEFPRASTGAALTHGAYVGYMAIYFHIDNFGVIHVVIYGSSFLIAGRIVNYEMCSLVRTRGDFGGRALGFRDPLQKDH